MVESGKMMTYAAVAVGAIGVAGLLFWMSKEDEEEVDYKVYNLERLREVFKEVELEVYCIYARNYAHMLGQKEEEKW